MLHVRLTCLNYKTYLANAQHNRKHLQYGNWQEDSIFDVATLTVQLEAESVSIKSLLQRKNGSEFGFHFIYLLTLEFVLSKSMPTVL
jgi:hypothetical protein